MELSNKVDELMQGRGQGIFIWLLWRLEFCVDRKS